MSLASHLRDLLVPDPLWARVEQLLPPPRPKPKGGRPVVPDRAALAGIVFVLRAGIGWERLPLESIVAARVQCIGSEHARERMMDDVVVDTPPGRGIRTTAAKETRQHRT